MSKYPVQKQCAGRFQKNEGFSHIEILIVLLILSIIFVAAIPQMQQNLRLYRIESATGLLVHSLTETKLTAIKHNRNAWLEINTAERKLEIWTTNQNNNPIRTNLDVMIPPEVALVAASPKQVTFNSLGRNQPNSMVVMKFQLTNTNFCKAITVSAVGNFTTAFC